MAIFALSAMGNEKRAQGKLLCGAHKCTGLTAALRSEYFGFPMLSEASSAVCGGSRLAFPLGKVARRGVSPHRDG